MLTLHDALDRLLAAATPVSGERAIPTIACAGRVLAQEQRSAIAVPPLDNSAMDGYAFNHADVVAAAGADGRVTLPISQRITAGSVGLPLRPGTAVRIFTGAPIPPGADTVLMQERTEADAEGQQVTLLDVPAAGTAVRRRGEDIGEGDTILPAGRKLTPQDVALAASVGLATLPVYRRGRVAVFFTGDELRMPGEPLPPGAIYNSNRFALVALLERLGCEVKDLGQVPDKLEATRTALREAVQQADLIVTSGGVSVGEEDHVKPAVEAEGRLDLWQVAIKPGKPLALGAVRGGDGPSGEVPFIGLPGNPVSSFVTFLTLVRPFVLKLQGVADAAPRSYPMRAGFSWTRPDPRRHEYLRVRLGANGELECFPNQGSGVLTSVAWADGLVENPPGTVIAPGDIVRFLPLAELLG